jgi:hypothetical protein
MKLMIAVLALCLIVPAAQASETDENGTPGPRITGCTSSCP